MKKAENELLKRGLNDESLRLAKDMVQMYAKYGFTFDEYLILSLIDRRKGYS